MPTLIISYSADIYNFLIPLLIGFNQCQIRHALNVVHGLLVGVAKHRVLTGITRLLRVKHADAYALADFFRVSGWDAQAVRKAMSREIVRVAVAVHQRCGGAVFASVDDTLCVKSVTTAALETVGFHHDHCRERAQHSHYSNAAKVLVLTLHVGYFCFAVDYRLYLKRKQVRQLNYHRARAGWCEPRLVYQSLPAMTEEMLRDLHALLPTLRRVYVLADGWFSSLSLFRLIIHDLHWDFIMASKGNRWLGRFRLYEWWHHLGHQPIRHVPIDSTKGRRIFLTRFVVARLLHFDTPVKAILSKSGRRRDPFVYLLCSNTALSANTVLQYYAHRWSIEVAHAFLKGRLGLGDFRLHSVEATLRWFALVFTAFAFVNVRAASAWLAQPHLPRLSASDVVLELQSEQLRFLVAQVAQKARNGLSDQAICAGLGVT